MGVSTSEEASAVVSAMDRRVALETEEWIPPQSPLSEEMTMKSLRLGFSSRGALAKTSVYMFTALSDHNTREVESGKKGRT